MTVDELIAQLQALSWQGHGTLPVCVNQCLCNDSDYDLEDEEIDKLEIKEPNPESTVVQERSWRVLVI